MAIDVKPRLTAVHTALSVGSKFETIPWKKRGTLLVALLLVCLLAFSGCGSSARTDSTEAHKVAAAERKFLNEWGKAGAVVLSQCSGMHGEAGARCSQRILKSRQGRAMVEFYDAIDALLDGGLGPRCAEELRDTRSFITEIPHFPGDASAVCREESRHDN